MKKLKPATNPSLRNNNKTETHSTEENSAKILQKLNEKCRDRQTKSGYQRKKKEEEEDEIAKNKTENHFKIPARIRFRKPKIRPTSVTEEN